MGDWESKSTLDKVVLTLVMLFFFVGVAAVLERLQFAFGIAQ